MVVLGDGSRWLCAEGAWRCVAEPGTDHHEMRWTHRMLPAWSRAYREALTLGLSDRADSEGVGRWRAAVDAVLEIAEEDDIALLAAQAWAGRSALDSTVKNNDVEQARHGQVMVRLLEDAWHGAVQGRKDPTGFEEFYAAIREWNEGHGQDHPGDTDEA